jgi:uncharacterized delta-60 repeat protein
MYARSLRSRRAEKLSVHSRNRLKRALGAVVEPLEVRVMLSAGDQLGTDVFTDFNDQLDVGGVIARLGSDKIIQAGTTVSATPGAKLEFLLAQFNADGTLDTSFDGDGLATAALPEDLAGYSILSINAVGVDAMGRIVVAGTANNDDLGDQDYLVARFNADGTLDTSFGSVGVVITDQTPAPSGAHVNQGRAMAIDGNKIVVAGSFAADGNIEIFGVVRYDVDGTIDNGFNGGEIAANEFSATSTDQLNAVTIDADGKIILAGNTMDTGTGLEFAVQRYNSDGTLDNDFGTNGHVNTVIDPVSQVDIAYAVTTDSQGRIIAGGTTAFADEFEFRIDPALVRYLNDGSLDLNFGNGGIVTTSLGNGMIGTINALAIQSDGKILIGGTQQDSETGTLSLLVGRYDENGALDPSFGGGIVAGIVTGYSFEGQPDSNRTSMVVLTDQLLSPDEVVLGNWVPGEGNGDFILSRYDLGAANNTAPTVAPISGPTSGVRNFSQTFSSSFSDPDADSWTVTWDFGDANTTSGNSPEGSISASHIYTATGIYSVTVSVDDGVNDPVLVDSFSITITDTSNSGGTLQLGGNGGNDAFTVRPGSGGSVIVTSNGSSTTYNGVNTILIAGGDGNDDIKVNPALTQNVIVFGGAGNDSIKGGAGNDILVGGDGDDLLHGQDGRDLLIGGDGADRIIGHADDDILVAGYTIYDSDVTALQAILSEWTSARTYAQRVSNIQGPTGANNGSYFLKPFDSSTNNSDATAFDDGDVDILTGNSGQDLFLFNSDVSGQDTITDLSASEFAVDMDWIMNP